MIKIKKYIVGSLEDIKQVYRTKSLTGFEGRWFSTYSAAKEAIIDELDGYNSIAHVELKWMNDNDIAEALLASQIGEAYPLESVVEILSIEVTTTDFSILKD